MGRPIGVAWLYEQLEGAVKRELGLEEQLAAAEARVEAAEDALAAIDQEWADAVAENALLRRMAEAAADVTWPHQGGIGKLHDALAAWDAVQEEAERGH